MGSGPLADSQLQEIESRLNAGRFDEAQRLLSELGNLANVETASVYFATRLLFQRGRMDQEGVIERLRELLAREPEFPEAARMLAAAEAGVLAPDPEAFRRVTAPPETVDADPGAIDIVRAPSPRELSRAPSQGELPPLPSQREIPRAPLVPRFTPRPGTPSYAPSTPLAPRFADAPELPPIPSLHETVPGVGPVEPRRPEPAPNVIAPEPEALANPLVKGPSPARRGAYSMRAASEELLQPSPALERARAGAAVVTEQMANARRWGVEEAALAAGNPALCLERLAREAKDAVPAASRVLGVQRWQALAVRAARSLTELPVFRHFAPYDCSMFSVQRLEGALSLLFGNGAGAKALDEATIVLLGAYVGETFRQAFGAEWHGALSAPFAASVQGIGLAVVPCERVRERLARGVGLSIETPHALHPGADPLGNSVPLSLVPPAPWDPAPFPSLADFSALGRGLRESVVGLYCERELAMPLDLSIAKLAAIDRYVGLLAPIHAPPDPEAAWARRAALLLGAYLGEVLVVALGAHWESELAPKSLDDYRLRLPRGSVATPALRVRERLVGRRPSPLSEYVARLAADRNSVGA